MVAFSKSNVYSLSQRVSDFFGRWISWCATWFFLILIGAYRAIGSLWLSGSCRFEPSCSEYAAEAIKNHGAWVGGKLAAIRLWSCRPGGRFGYDPVPTEKHLCATHNYKCDARNERV